MAKTYSFTLNVVDDHPSGNPEGDVDIILHGVFKHSEVTYWVTGEIQVSDRQEEDD